MMGFIFSVPEICPVDSMIGQAIGMTLWNFVVYFFVGFFSVKTMGKRRSSWLLRASGLA